MRTPAALRLLKADDKAQPTLDCETRWGSEYDMVDSLLDLRTFCEEMDDDAYNLSRREWKVLEELRRCLKPARMCTLELQKEQLTMGDFYNSWLQCKILTRRASCKEKDLASIIVSQMESREKDLFQTKAFITGLFLDPRYDVMLEDHQRDLAVKHIVEVFERLQQLKNQESAQVDQAESELDETFSSEDEEEEDPVERILRQKEKQSARASGSAINSESSAKDKLLRSVTKYGKMKRLPKKENLFKFWEKQKSNMPELYEVVCTLLSVPCTQVNLTFQ